MAKNLRYFRNGKPMSDVHNQLGHIASMHTKGIEADKPRIPAAQLVSILADLGVTEPREPGWMVDLPNGVTLEARAEGEPSQYQGEVAPSRPRKPAASKKADEAAPVAPKGTEARTPAKKASKATKRTPGQKARAAKTTTPKASTGRKVTTNFKESAKKS